MLLVVGEINCETDYVEVVVYDWGGLGIPWVVFEEIEDDFAGAWDWWLWGGVCSVDEDEWLYED